MISDFVRSDPIGPLSYYSFHSILFVSRNVMGQVRRMGGTLHGMAPASEPSLGRSDSYVSPIFLVKVVNILSQCRARFRILLTSTSARILGPCRILWYSPFWVFCVACINARLRSALAIDSTSCCPGLGFALHPCPKNLLSVSN